MSRITGFTGSVLAGLCSICVIAALLGGPIPDLLALLLLGGGLGAAPALLLALSPGHKFPAWAVIVHCALTVAMLFAVFMLGLSAAGSLHAQATRLAVGVLSMAGCGALSGGGYVVGRRLAS